MDNPTHRALIVYESLSLHGPQTLAQLDMRLDSISRMAIHRGLTHLRQMGWVRMRRGDNAWTVTPHLADKARHTPQRLPWYVDTALPAVPKSCDLAIGKFTALGVFEVIEASGPLRDDAPLNLALDPAPQVALSVIEVPDALRHVQAWMPDASSKDRAWIVAGQLNVRLRRLRRDGLFWSHKDRRCALPLIHGDLVGAVQISAKSVEAKTEAAQWVADAKAVLERDMDYPAKAAT
ncbi:MAG: hypothetical protein ACWA40_11170 [Planktomarina sp.]